MNTNKPCAGCIHVDYIASSAQHVCEHPDVSDVSVVSGARIGTDASAVRYRAFSLGKRMCGPDGLWWQEKQAQAPARETT